MIHSAIDFQYSSSSVFAGVPFVYSFFYFPTNLIDRRINFYRLGHSKVASSERHQR